MEFEKTKMIFSEIIRGYLLNLPTVNKLKYKP